MLTCCTECRCKFEVDDEMLFQLVNCEKCHKEFRASWYVKPSSEKIDISSEDSEGTDDHTGEEVSGSPKKKRKTVNETVAEQTAIISDGFNQIMPKINDAIERNENESGTRLIFDRILQNILAYKLEDINTEQKIQGRKADYVLSVKDKDALVIEIKRINMPLKDKQIFQATSYGAYSGIRWALLTNVAVWQLYRITTAEKVEANSVFTIDLRDGFTESSLQYFYLISKHGMSREGLLDKLWQKINTLSNENLISAILTDAVITKIRTTLTKETGGKLTNDDVRATIEKDLFQLE